MTVYVKVAVAIALACCSTVAVAEDLTLQDVIALTEMQLSDAAIIAILKEQEAGIAEARRLTYFSRGHDLTGPH